MGVENTEGNMNTNNSVNNIIVDFFAACVHDGDYEIKHNDLNSKYNEGDNIPPFTAIDFDEEKLRKLPFLDEKDIQELKRRGKETLAIEGRQGQYDRQKDNKDDKNIE